MPSNPSIYLDANVLIAYVNGEAGRAELVEQVLSDATEGRVGLITSTLSIVEVAYAVTELGEADDADLVAIDELWEPSSPIRLVEPSVVVMREARKLLRSATAVGSKIKPADAIHLATAVLERVAEVFTYEAENTRERWANLAGISIVAPSVREPRLPMD